MATRTVNGHGEGSKPSFGSPSTYPNEGHSTPRLEVSEVDSAPFSQDFVDLFEGLGLHIPTSTGTKRRNETPDASYDLEHVTNIRDLVPEWQDDDIDEIVFMSSKRRRTLPTIQEVQSEKSPLISSAGLHEFSFDIPDNFEGAANTASSRLCIRRDTGVKYIIKRSRAGAASSLLERTMLATLTDLHVPFTSHLRWAFHEGEQMYTVTDYYPSGNLLDLIKRHGPLGSHRTTLYASELVVALSSLHAAGIVHGALEPQNIMLDREGHMVVTDFSWADYISSAESQSAYHMAVRGLVMPDYQAPEVCLGWAYNGKVDCWSFGMLIFFMLFASHPFQSGQGESLNDHAPVRDRILRSSISTESLRLISPLARDLILKCLERNPSVRWSIDEVKHHAHFALVDWEKVSSRRLEVPALTPSSPVVNHLYANEVRQRRMSIIPEIQDENSFAASSHSVCRLQQPAKIVPGVSVQVAAPILPNLFKPLPRVIIPSIVTEEDESISLSETTGHRHSCEAGEERGDDPDTAERMSRFWAKLDQEERGSVVSDTSQEFGETGGKPQKAPKLRKHRSSIHPPRHHLFSLSTVSFHSNKLRKKTRSAGALRPPPPPKVVPEPIENLPFGVHQIGSGIGFTYNLPASMPSKLSVCSFAPQSCHNLFHGGLSGFNLGLGFGHSGRKGNSKANLALDNPQAQALDPNPARASDDEDLDFGLALHPMAREASNGTFIRDMYRTPSWILSPPDSVPSPLALVNDNCNDDPNTSRGVETSDSSPRTEPEPLTPATLVHEELDSGRSEEINICIPKTLDVQYDFEFPGPGVAPDSTLRLVPRSTIRLSFAGEGDISLFTL